MMRTSTIVSSLYKCRAITSTTTALRRRTMGSAAKPKMTAAEREKSLHEANEKMRSYYVNRPSLEVLERARNKPSQKESDESAIQKCLLAGFLVAFLATPFLGRRIAQDKEFRDKYVPTWYDYTIKKPKNAWTRAELHDQLIEVQAELHDRAIRGDFSPEKLDQMRRHFSGVDPDDDEHGWGKLHPGVDDDEDIEDD